jgi:hypothetical protein
VLVRNGVAGRAIVRRAPRERIDLLVYARAFGVLFRNPTVIIVPLLVAVIAVFVAQITNAAGGGPIAGFTGGITGFIVLLLQLFGLGTAIIIGDAGWRRGTVRFDDAWQDARRKGGDLLFAAFGFTFVLSIAQYAGSIVGSTAGLIITALAIYGLIYTIAAAAIGGVPGSAAISVSIDRVKSAPLTAAILTVVAIVLLFFFTSFIGAYVDLWLSTIDGASPIFAALIDALVRAIVTGYLGIVMAKVYSDVSFTMPRF